MREPTDPSAASHRPNARSVARPVPALSPGDTCQRAFERFSADPDLLALAVVEEGSARPVGLVSRHDFLIQFGRPYGRALYSDKSVTVLMDADPLVVDADEVVEMVGARIVRDKPAALLRGFVVVAQGRYFGIGTGLAVLGVTLDSLMRRTEELSQAHRGAIAANKAKSTFLAHMSHELRTPLNATIGFADLIANQAFGPDATERYRDYAGDIGRAGRHLLELINDILDISKIEAGRMELELADRDMGAELAGVLRTCGAQAEVEGLALALDRPDGPIPVFADARSLRQIALNLISNAIKFSPRGAPIRVALLAPDGDGMSGFRVEDFGCGIPARKLERVWQPFERIDNSYGRASAGSGLGLSLVRQLTELHRGRVCMESGEGQGTRVTVRLHAEARRFSESAGLDRPVLTLRAGRSANPEGGAARTGAGAAAAAARDHPLERIMAAWYTLFEETGHMPTRAGLAGRVGTRPDAWMSLYAPAGKDDFRIVEEGRELVRLTEESWRDGLASDVDARHGGDLSRVLNEAVLFGHPCLHLRKELFRIKGRKVDRLVLPIRGPRGEARWALCFLTPAGGAGLEGPEADQPGLDLDGVSPMPSDG